MYRETVKKYRGGQTRVCITLARGKYVLGTIVESGPEAMLVRSGKDCEQLVMKHAVETISPARESKPRKE